MFGAGVRIIWSITGRVDGLSEDFKRVSLHGGSSEEFGSIVASGQEENTARWLQLANCNRGFDSIHAAQDYVAQQVIEGAFPSDLYTAFTTVALKPLVLRTIARVSAITGSSSITRTVGLTFPIIPHSSWESQDVDGGIAVLGFMGSLDCSTNKRSAQCLKV
jgi:hypothetical protein